MLDTQYVKRPTQAWPMEAQSPSLEVIAKHPTLFLGQLWLPTYTVELCNFKSFSLKNIVSEDQDPSALCDMF